MTPLKFRRDFWRQKTRRCLRDPMYSRFGTVPACDGQSDRRTDRRTDGHTTTAYTALA